MPELGELTDKEFEELLERFTKHLNAGLDRVKRHMQKTLLKAMKQARFAPWVPCDHCENYWCTIHDKHVYDCECPEIEEWEVSPYLPQDGSDGSGNF